MDVKALNKLLLVVIVVLLVAVAGVTVWALLRRGPYDVRIGANTLPVPAGTADTTRQALIRFESSLQAFALSQSDRDRRLEEAIKASREGGKNTEVTQLQGELERQRADWERYQKELDDWRKSWEASVAAKPADASLGPTVAPAPLPPPPAPPSPETENTSDGSGDGDFGAFADTAAAAGCIAEPAACIPLQIIASFLKGLSAGQREEVIKLAAAIAKGQGVPPEVVDAAAEMLKGNPEARDKVFDVVEKAAHTPEVRKTVEDLQKRLEDGVPPELRTLADRVAEMARQGRECKDILESLSRRGDRFASVDQRDLIRGRLIAESPEVYERAWNHCLAEIGAPGAAASAETAP